MNGSTARVVVYLSGQEREKFTVTWRLFKVDLCRNKDENSGIPWWIAVVVPQKPLVHADGSPMMSSGTDNTI